MAGIPLNGTPFSDLLPDSVKNDPKFQAAGLALDAEFIEIDKATINLKFWSHIDDLEEPLLSTLGWQLSLIHEYAWKLAESLTAKRELIKNGIELHKFKGTPWSIRELVRCLGFGEIEIIEGLMILKRDGSSHRNGQRYHGGHDTNWARYRIIFKQPITNDQAILLRKAIEEYAPARSELVSFDYQAVAIRHNGFAKRNGSYNRGRIKNG
ncbi:phage tail protein [Budviciaceae bacterium CWB-B4]|uniref:Phage tail protein n=1 Tax=Limnobaculum xujianqingii TaxID=2738837 RepID=A0A9D7FXX8_9GAMM|nr:phage tail protein [Limnobaculum xujianqingii]MBK5073217.1 phage tail protein [Limnobaculum xujianqingii]MBK5176526.1 phage tail protein [Limnobaculum xujianqingii]